MHLIDLRRLTSAALLSLVATATLTAQSGPLARVRFANHAPTQYRGWSQATVPFAQGQFRPGMVLGVPGRRSELTPFGARWPDGSYRYGVLSVQLDQQPYTETVVDVGPTARDQQPFVWSAWMQHAIAHLNWELAVGVPGRGVRTAGLRLVGIPFASNIRLVLHFQSRIPDTFLVYDLWLTARSDQDWLEFELKLTSSSPQSQAWQEDLDWVELWTHGGIPVVRGAARRGVWPAVAESTMGPNRLVLLGPTQLWDAQGHEWWGDFICYHAQIPVPDREVRAQTLYAQLRNVKYGCALNWAESGAFGPFGLVPAFPSWITDGGRAAAKKQREQYEHYSRQPGSTWDDLPLGLLPRASTTGDQPDFGISKLGDIFASGLPDRIEEARFSASEEANRPVHHRELDGTPVQARNHPKWVSWSGRTHFNTTVSPDRLGKPVDEPYCHANGWSGRDHQHWSSLTLASAYLLTASPALRAELDVEAELFLAAHTVPSLRGQIPTNGIDTPRAIGRTLLSMSWNWLCTGRDDLRIRMLARLNECIHVQHVGLHTGGAVAPVVVVGPDIRTLPNYSNWRPWEESMAIVGLEALYRITGEPLARKVAAVTAANLIVYGWKVDATDCIVGTAIAWNSDGRALTPQEYTDPEKVLWSYGTSFSLWGLGAAKLARGYARLLGEQALEQRAAEIVNRISGSRSKPSDGGWDRFIDWDGVDL